MPPNLPPKPMLLITRIYCFQRNQPKTSKPELSTINDIRHWEDIVNLNGDRGSGASREGHLGPGKAEWGKWGRNGRDGRN